MLFIQCETNFLLRFSYMSFHPARSWRLINTTSFEHHNNGFHIFIWPKKWPKTQIWGLIAFVLVAWTYQMPATQSKRGHQFLWWNLITLVLTRNEQYLRLTNPCTLHRKKSSLTFLCATWFAVSFLFFLAILWGSFSVILCSCKLQYLVNWEKEQHSQWINYWSYLKPLLFLLHKVARPASTNMQNNKLKLKMTDTSRVLKMFIFPAYLCTFHYMCRVFKNIKISLSQVRSFSLTSECVSLHTSHRTFF